MALVRKVRGTPAKQLAGEQKAAKDRVHSKAWHRQTPVFQGITDHPYFTP
jgi:hypothetical protein